MRRVSVLVCAVAVVAIMGCGGSGTPVTTLNVTLGSLLHPTLGPSVDLDAASLQGVKSVEAIKSGSGVDIIISYSGAKSAMRVTTPVYARDSSGVSVYVGWDTAAATDFVKVAGTKFTSLSTAEEIRALYSAGPVITSSDVTKGDAFVVKTDQGKYVAFEVVDFEQTSSGTSTIAVKR